MGYLKNVRNHLPVNSAIIFLQMNVVHYFLSCVNLFFQLWTMYCESFAATSSPMTDNYTAAHTTVMDFWGRVTPGILQLLSHSKVVGLLKTPLLQLHNFLAHLCVCTVCSFAELSVCLRQVIYMCILWSLYIVYLMADMSPSSFKW